MLTPIKAGHIVYSLCDAWEGAGYCSISWRPLEAQQRNFHVSKHIVEFSYVFEGVLSRVRDAELRAEANLIALLLSCCDHVSEMLGHLATSDEIYLGHLKRSHRLIRQLRAYHKYKIVYATAA